MDASTRGTDNLPRGHLSGPASSPGGVPTADAYTALYNSNNFLKDRYNRLNKDQQVILKNIKKHLTPDMQRLLLADTSVARSSGVKNNNVTSKSESDAASKNVTMQSHTSGSLSSQGAVSSIYPSLAADKNSNVRPTEEWSVGMTRGGAVQVHINKEPSPSSTDITDAYLLTDLRHLVQESLKQGRALQRVQEQLRAQSALLKSMDDQTNYNYGHDNSTRPSHGDAARGGGGVYTDHSDEWTMVPPTT